MIDASFVKIEKIIHHPGADKLDIATVSGCDVICQRDTYNVGDVVFYIRDDAKLVEYDNFNAWKSAKDSIDTALSEGKLTQDEYDVRLEKIGAEYKFKYPYQKELMTYLGGGGRVRTIKLRGMYSSGIIVPVDAVYSHINKAEAKNWEADNIKLTSEFNGPFLSGKFGIVHFSIPLTNNGDLKSRGNMLIPGLWKTDEENWYNIKDSDFPWDEEVLITRKLDGSSESISASPDGEVHIMSRSMDLMINADNNFTRAAAEVIPLIKEYAKHYNTTIVVRGEMTSANTNKNKSNIDSVGEPKFHMFATVFLNESDAAKRIGLWGTENHFLEVNKRIKELTGREITTVPIIGTAKLTKQLLIDYENAPRCNGEGVVINTKSIILPHFKSKSKDYLANMR